jgi:hypothetical protein
MDVKEKRQLYWRIFFMNFDTEPHHQIWPENGAVQAGL